MKLQVKLFAGARELAGAESVEVFLPEPPTVASLRAALAAQHPVLATLAAQSLFAVDAQYADDGAKIAPHADVACIPPVSGG